MFIDEKAVGEAPVKVVTMKLSEAIRRGSKRRGQCVGALFEGGRSCALGAAYEGITGYQTKDDFNGWVDFITERTGATVDVLREVAGWNDDGYSREAIADRLESRGL